MITVVDSCTCGMATIPALLAAAPKAALRYLADYRNNPLGDKSPKEIFEILGEWRAFAMRGPAKDSCLVVACNTVSVVLHTMSLEARGGEECRVVTTVDAFREMIECHREDLYGARVLVLGTTVTTRDPTYDALLRDAKVAKIYCHATPAAEHVVASGAYRETTAAKAALQELHNIAQAEWDIVILACSCFPYLREHYKRLFPKALLCAPTDYLAAVTVRGHPCAAGNEDPPGLDIYSTGDAESLFLLKDFASDLLGGGSNTMCGKPINFVQS